MINTDNVEAVWNNFDMSEYPDFCSAYIVSADIEDDGVVHACTTAELKELNNHPAHNVWRTQEKYGMGWWCKLFHGV